MIIYHISNVTRIFLRKGKVVQISIRETKFLHLNIQIIQRDKDRWTEHDQSSLRIYRFMLFLETVLEKSRRCSVYFLATEDSLVTAVTGGGLGSERALWQLVRGAIKI